MNRANLLNASLAGRNLAGANLVDRDLSGADLVGANLGGADLRNTNLAGAQLGAADLSNANLTSTNLGGADLRDARGLTREQLLSANIDGLTRLPSKFADLEQGWNSPKHEAKLHGELRVRSIERGPELDLGLGIG